VVSIEASEGTVDENQLPVVDAGSDQTVDAETTVNLQGSATDADSSDLTYRWEQLSGATVSISQADSAAAEFTAPGEAAELSFKLTVTDDVGGEGSDSVVVNVVVPPPPPVVTPAASSGGGGCTLSHNASSDSSLLMLLLALSLLMVRRRYLVL